jgi:LuxR family transcriptional regulator, maltose regulon positive regulatory protein
VSSSILATKLYMPASRAGLLPRPRLKERLETILATRLTLVSAPAGFGKSSLISNWIHTHPQFSSPGFRSAWLSLDREDDDPARFWEYFLAVFKTLKLDQVHLEQAQVLLQGQENPPYPLILTDLINQIADLEICGVIVLDDLHVIQSPLIFEGLIFLVEHLPSQLHLIFCTRSDPPFPLGRWRVRGLLNEIRSAQLRFSLEEAAQYFNQSMGLHLADQHIRDLENRTEGWIAGLQMAALSLLDQDQAAISNFISGFSGQHHLILDYLTDEVLRRQPEPVQNFLLKTSILSHLHAPLCDALLADQREPASTVNLLEQLEHANLFIIPLDANRSWYRCHHLFRDLLLVRLREAFPGELTTLHRRAAVWFENNGFPFEAMHHASEVQDLTLAADVIERTIRKPATWSTGNMSRMLDAVKALPEEIIDARPWLRVYLSGILYVGGFLENADQMLAKIEKSIQPNSDQEQLRIYTNVYRAYYAAVRGDVSTAIQRSNLALGLLPTDDMTVRGHALSALGWATFLRGEVEQAGRFLVEAIQNQRKKNARFTMITWMCNLANVQMTQGRLHAAAQTCEEAIQVGTTQQMQSPTVGLAKIYLGAIYFEWNRLAEAENHIRDGITLMQNGGITPNFGLAHALLARVCQTNGKPEEAKSLIKTGLQIAKNSKLDRYIEIVTAFQARLWLAENETSLAMDWAVEFQQLPEAEYLREFSKLTQAQVYLASGQENESMSCCREIIAAAEPAGRMGVVVEALTLLAAAQLKTTGGEGDAIAALQRAVNLAAPEGYQRIFLDRGVDLNELLNHLNFTSQEEYDYVGKILDAFAIHSPKDISREPFRNQSLRANPTGLIEPLSGREMEILQLISTGLTNSEIAQKLHITLNTMRAHTTHIFGKLGVHNRTEAVAKARALKFI